MILPIELYILSPFEKRCGCLRTLSWKLELWILKYVIGLWITEYVIGRAQVIPHPQQVPSPLLWFLPLQTSNSGWGRTFWQTPPVVHTETYPRCYSWQCPFPDQARWHHYLLRKLEKLTRTMTLEGIQKAMRGKSSCFTEIIVSISLCKGLQEARTPSWEIQHVCSARHIWES